MAEVLSGGCSVEYICRIADETSGQESVPETGTMAESNLNGKGKKGGGKKGADNASNSKTDAYLNPALSVAMPALNGFTDGVAGQVVGKGRQVLNLGKQITKGAGAAAVFGAAAPLLAWGIGELINKFSSARSANDALADSIDKTNFRRQLAGMGKINYTRSGITGQVRLEEDR